MFHKLEKKYKRLLLSSVIVISICYGLAVFFFYFDVLKDDFRDKLTYFNKQQVYNVEKSLWRTEFSMNTLLSRIELNQSNTFYQYEAYNELQKISNFNLDITATFLISSKTLSVIASDNYDLANYLLQQYPSLFDRTSYDIRWYYLKYESHDEDLLLCIKSVAQPADADVYTFGLLIPAKTVLPITITYVDKPSVFSRNNFSFSIHAKEDAVLFMENTENNDSTPSSELDTDSSELYATPISSTPFTLHMQATEESLNQMLILFFVGIMLLCIMLIGAASFVLNRFLKQLTTALESLSDNFSHFLDTFDR